jgi:dihydroorotase
MSSLLIRNGRIVDPASGMDAIGDVLIVNGKIARLGGSGENADEILDATGKIVAPGFIDMHVHLREPGLEHAETIESGSRAAVAGGFTSICCMPNTMPVNDSPMVTRFIVERARKMAACHVFPIGAITKGSEGEEIAPIGSMKAAGVVAISDDGRPVMNARVTRRAMEFARSFDLPLIQHCEDLNLSAGGDMHEGPHSTRLGLRGIPSASEDVMVARDILLAELTGVRYHVAHLSTKNAVAMVAFAKSRGLTVTAEATPHHFAITDAELANYDSNYKMKPPLRSDADVTAVIDGIVSGAIDAIATDHAPHTGSQKMQEFERCPFGITGLETAIGLSLDTLVHSGKISVTRLIALFTTGPEGILRLGRGKLAEGGIADVTVLDLDSEWTYTAERSCSKSKNSPFDGRRFRGGPFATVVSGQIVWRRE